MISKRILAAAMFAVLLTGCRAQPQSAQPVTVSPAGLDVVPLEVRSGDKVHAFRTEVARTDEEQQRGMMFREQIGPNEGMVFPFSPPKVASFWMKNTPIPLDLIFVRPDCSIAWIAANAAPYSLQPIAHPEPVVAVLEIAGGRAAELGISEGDCVTWPDGPAG